MVAATSNDANPASPAALRYSGEKGSALELIGDWSGPAAFSKEAELRAVFAKLPAGSQIKIGASQLTGWDATTVAVLTAAIAVGDTKQVIVDTAALPEGVSRILTLATAIKERKGARRSEKHLPLLSQIGESTLGVLSEARNMITFVGDLAIAMGRLAIGKARFQRRDLIATIEQCGPQALPIVTLISGLVGLILAFIGAVQLLQFGAQIYVANLVSIAMAREMGALMVGIILAGRTGAAFAAQLGTMQVNEEIDALQTLGIKPMEFLVLPRAIALMLMMPLLCIYADLVGMIGGAVIGIFNLGIAPMLYYDQSVTAVGMTDFAIGLVKSAVFGVIVAVCGCMRGMQSGRSASAVGEAATSAVVTTIVLITITDAIFAVVTNILNL